MDAQLPPPLRPVRYGEIRATAVRRDDGSIEIRPTRPAPAALPRVGDALRRWAAAAPERTFLAERTADGTGWRTLSFGQALEDAERIAAALLARGLGPERPILILSGASIDHGRLALGAQLAGVPFCPLSTAYSLISTDFGKLKAAAALLEPGMIVVDACGPYARAIAAAAAAAPQVEIVASAGALPDRAVTPFADLLAAAPGPAARAAMAAVGPDAIAKLLLTSGSTGQPKAVINTHGMLCANQAMIADTLAFLADAPPVVLDWLPWSHTFGGNHNFGLALFNGGALHLDAGKPAPGAFETTARNLRELSPTVMFNVPKGYEMLAARMAADPELRRAVYARLQAMFFAGASLSAHVWRRLDALSVAETGARVPMLTSFGATETAPFSLSVTPETCRPGHIGLPVAGNALRLVPVGDKLEMRVKGANVTPGYWRQPEMTAAAFDAEGWYRYGDAVRPADPDDFAAGLDFDGRIAEDFKLASGTWVSVGPLRAQAIAALAPFVRDLAIAGLDRDAAAAILILDPDGCRGALPELAEIHELATLAAHPALRAALAERLAAFAAAATGSATRLIRAAVLDEPPSIDRGEITDKGSINQRALLACRAALVDALYAEPPPDFVIVAWTGA